MSFLPAVSTRKALCRAIMATLSSIAFVVPVAAVAASPAAAASCTFDTYRIHPSGHQQVTYKITGCKSVGARHFWCADSWCNSGAWTNWMTYSSSALSPYKQYYAVGEGQGVAS